jgi:hypothetical protein
LQWDNGNTLTHNESAKGNTTKNLPQWGDGSDQPSPHKVRSKNGRLESTHIFGLYASRAKGSKTREPILSESIATPHEIKFRHLITSLAATRDHNQYHPQSMKTGELGKL